jgi:hypothetical protein
MERDQQGTSNLFNYNYWGSPVTTNGTTYSLGSMLYDGNNPSTPVAWTAGLNGSPSPLTLSTRWLYIFNDKQFDDYYGWTQITPGTSVNVGLGYLTKGSGAASADQNYTFRGQPNNGLIQNSISAGTRATLVGNPYPSAIDAHTFIDDNVSALLDGTLIFWEQSPTNNTHYLAQYEGRYSYYNKIGGIAPTTPPEINGSGTAAKLPQRYVPVGQGFFVNGDATGGNITFNNNQRVFVKESSGNSIFFEANDENNDITSQTNENDTFVEEIDNVQRVRLTFKTPEGATRHLLLGFTVDNAATDGADYGYDGLLADDFPSDMSFVIDGKKYVIQGVGEFDIDKQYPLSMVLGERGNIEIALSELENFDEDIDVFIYDALLDTYTKLNAVDYTNNLDSNTYDNRFFITFKDNQEALDITEEKLNNIQVNYLLDSQEIYVKVPQTTDVKQIYLINIAGQVVKSWNTLNFPNTNNFKIPVKNISEGTYVLRLQSDSGTVNKKVIINQ